MTEANGKYKWVAAALGAGLVALLAWNLTAIPALQSEGKAQVEKIDRLRIDLDYLRQAFTNNETETRAAVATAQAEQRATSIELLKTLNFLQLQIAGNGVNKDGKH